MMLNTIIENQRLLLQSHDNPEGVTEQGENTGNPPTPASLGVPGQEYSQGLGQGASPQADIGMNTTDPQAGSEEALKQQITALERKVQEFESLYNRQHGMVAPLQRKTSEQERIIADLTHQISDLRSQVQGASNPPAKQDDTTQPLSVDDPKLQQFMEDYGDMIPGLTALINRTAAAVVQPHLQQIKPALDYADNQRQQDERSAMLNDHLAPLYARYPQAGNIIRSEHFAAWVEKQPSYLRDSIVERCASPEDYPVDQVISVFDDYSRTAQAQPAPQTFTQAPSPGEMAIETRRIPTSSTPGGNPAPQPLTRERLQFINNALTVNRSLYNEAQIASLKQELEQGENAAIASGFGMAPRLDTLTR